MTLKEHIFFYYVFFQEIKSHFRMGWILLGPKHQPLSTSFRWQMSRCRTLYCDSVSTFSSTGSEVPMIGTWPELRSIRREIKSFQEGPKKRAGQEFVKTRNNKNHWPMKTYQSLKAAQKFHLQKWKIYTQDMTQMFAFGSTQDLLVVHLRIKTWFVSNPIAPQGEGSFSWYAESQQFSPDVQ